MRRILLAHLTATSVHPRPHVPCPPACPPPGLSATEEVPGSIEARLSPQLAQAAEFTPQELEHIDGESLVGLS